MDIWFNWIDSKLSIIINYIIYFLLDGGIPLNRPSSPLLSALRQAVDSLSNMEDFEQLECIGAGFFAEVFKVNYTTIYNNYF